ncbi:hypothetical protein [Actinomadura violacea]|uniref:Uncharacterized protein n=1 Tax=Actinomadura violacea TaxID=2819934 RepID=A0ABS3RWI8_9ACTN|nr:hypothetical protein [Actinomadura violacea]MBO2461126.1 hypothetical protein [Actinomadura violacea]
MSSTGPFFVRRFTAAGGYTRWDIHEAVPGKPARWKGSSPVEANALARAAALNAAEARFRAGLARFHRKTRA